MKISSIVDAGGIVDRGARQRGRAVAQSARPRHSLLPGTKLIQRSAPRPGSRWPRKDRAQSSNLLNRQRHAFI